MTSSIPISLSFEDGCSVQFAFSPPPLLNLAAAGSPSVNLNVGTIIYRNAEEYQGEYEVTPRTYEQVLATRNKRLSENVTVFEIPYHQTTNQAGGYTVSIAS